MTPKESPQWTTEVEPMTGRSFLTWSGYRVFEVKLFGYSEQVVGRLNSHDNLTEIIRAQNLTIRRLERDLDIMTSRLLELRGHVDLIASAARRGQAV
jgi:hypothetical protein